MNTNSSGDCYFSFSFFLWIYVLRALVLRNLPLGWRFHPSDEELVGYYLMQKRRGDPFDNLVDISEVQLCDHDPWDLPGLSKNTSGDKIWYFFCPREYCGKNSRLVKRRTPNGHWKCTGETYSVTREESDEEIGIRRILVFENPGATPWVIHEYEYTAELGLPIQGNFVLCKLMIKTNKKKKVIKKKKKAEPDCKNPRPNKKARKSKSDCNIASASAHPAKNSNSKRVMVNSAYGDGEPSNHMISNVDNQNSSIIAAFATYEKGKSSYLEALANDSQSPYEITSISTSDKGETSSLEASSFENQNLYQVTDVSACNKGEMRWPVASDLKDHNPNEMTPMSLYMESTLSCPGASCLENQNSYEMTIVSTNTKGSETSCPKTFDFENQNSYENSYKMTNKLSCDKGKPSYLLTLDFGDQNPCKSIDISASKEGKWSFLLEVPSDLDDQNNFTETDMSFLKDCSSPSMPSNVGEATFQDLRSQNDTDTSIPEVSVSCLENQNSYEMTIISTNNKGYETSCLKNFDFENQNSYENSYEMTNKLSCDKGKPSYPITLDSENQNPCNSIDTSAFTEGKWSFLLEVTSDFDGQNHFTETDMSFLKDCLSPSMPSNVGEATFQDVQSQRKDTDTSIPDNYRDILTALSTQERGEAMLKKVQNQQNKDRAIYPWMASDVGEDTFPEIYLQLEEESIAFSDLEDCLNSAPEQHIHNNKIPNSSTSFASVSI